MKNFSIRWWDKNQRVLNGWSVAECDSIVRDSAIVKAVDSRNNSNNPAIVSFSVLDMNITSVYSLERSRVRRAIPCYNDRMTTVNKSISVVYRKCSSIDTKERRKGILDTLLKFHFFMEQFIDLFFGPKKKSDIPGWKRFSENLTAKNSARKFSETFTDFPIFFSEFLGFLLDTYLIFFTHSEKIQFFLKA